MTQYAKIVKPTKMKKVGNMKMGKKKSKDKEVHVSEDEVKKLQDEIQKTTDSYIKKMDDLLAHKEKEIMTV